MLKIYNLVTANLKLHKIPMLHVAAAALTYLVNSLTVNLSFHELLDLNCCDMQNSSARDNKALEAISQQRSHRTMCESFNSTIETAFMSNQNWTICSS